MRFGVNLYCEVEYFRNTPLFYDCWFVNYTMKWFINFLRICISTTLQKDGGAENLAPFIIYILRKMENCTQIVKLISVR